MTGEHLKTVHSLIPETKMVNIHQGLSRGMKEKDLQETETKDVILGTFSYNEGFDCKYPNIFLMSPNNIEQAVDRILRQEVKDENLFH